MQFLTSPKSTMGYYQNEEQKRRLITLNSLPPKLPLRLMVRRLALNQVIEVQLF